MKTLKKWIKGIFINLFIKKYIIVAYNNRTYEGYKYVNNYIYTRVGAKNWIGSHGNFERYIYDLYDVRTEKLLYDYTEMIEEFKYVRDLIQKTNSDYSESLRNYIFNFKNKWTLKFGEGIVKIYFEDLMAIFQANNKKIVKF